MKELAKLFGDHTGRYNPEIEPLPSSGSNRRYYRLKQGDVSLIGVAGQSKEENRAFIELSRHFRRQKLNTPEVHAVSNDEMFYIQQDLGDDILFDAIKGGGGLRVFSVTKRKSCCTKQSPCLPIFRSKELRDSTSIFATPLPEFNRRSVMWDLNYFKYNFLKTTGMDFLEDLLENDFEKLADTLLKNETDTFMYRDFQSRNVMLVNGNPYFIDFQGGRKGPVYYDVASFLWQAKPVSRMN